MMNKEDQQLEYRKASMLYKQCRYVDALSIFDRLAAERPDSKRLTYSRAMCMLALGRVKDARLLCNKLATHRSKSARDLTEKLDAALEQKQDQLRSRTKRQEPQEPNEKKEDDERRRSSRRRGADNRRRLPDRRSSMDRRQEDERRHDQVTWDEPERRSGDDRRRRRDRRRPRSRRKKQERRHASDRRLGFDDAFPMSDLTETCEKPRKKRGGKLKVVVGLTVTACVVVAAGFYVVNQTRYRYGTRSSLDQNIVPSIEGPDRYIETITFWPAGTKKSFRLAVFVAPMEGERVKADENVEDKVGSGAASDWQEAKSTAKKAFDMMAGRTGIIAGVPQNDMVRTVVFPQATGVAIIGSGGETQLETFSPVSGRTMAALVKACGEPSHVESWNNRSRAVGLNGETSWWGRIGVAADAEGLVTHLLIRRYPD